MSLDELIPTLRSLQRDDGDAREAAIDRAAREVARSFASLVQLAPELALHAPEAFLEPRLRAAFHAGLEVDAWGTTDLATLLDAALSDVERFVHFMRIPTRAPLGVRLRVARLALAVAMAAHDFGLDAVLPEQRRSMFAATLTRLVVDRNMFVAARATCAVGALRSVWPELWEHADLSSPNAFMERRRAAAWTSSWLIGDVEASVVEREVVELGARNAYALGMAVHALRVLVARAPHTVEAVLLTWIEGASLPGLSSACALASTLGDADARATIMNAVRERSSRSGAATTPILRPWLELDEASEKVLDAYRSVRRAAETGPNDGRTCARFLLDEARVRERDVVIDLVLFDSPVVRDVAVAAASSREDAAAARRKWLGTVAAQRDLRSARLRDAHVHPSIANEHLRSLAFALDALLDERPATTDWGALFADARGRLSRADTMTDRNVAITIGICLDALADARSDAEQLVIALTLPPRVLRHLARAISREGLRRAIASAADLYDCTSNVSNEPTAASARALRQRLGAFAEAAAALGARGDHPLALALNGAAAATDAMLRRPGMDGVIRDVWARALQAYDVARGAKARDEVALRQRIETISKRERNDDPSTIAPWPLGDVLAAALAHRGALQPDAQAERWHGRTIGDYVVERELGSGAMGCCLLARLRSDKRDRRWVLKLPRGRVRGSRGEATRETFRAEARALLGLANAHPAIVPFIGYHEQGYRAPFLVMGFIDGETLTKRLQRGPLKTTEALDITRTLASGLACAHARRIGHHDIKPDNIVLAKPKGDAVLVDWGIAGAEFRAGGGTYGYMPPERFRSQPLDVASVMKGDIFALGCTLFHMLACRDLALPPFDQDDAGVSPGLVQGASKVMDQSAAFYYVCEAIANDTRLLAARIRRALPTAPKVAQLIESMTYFDCDKRPQAADVVRAIEGIA